MPVPAVKGRYFSQSDCMWSSKSAQFLLSQNECSSLLRAQSCKVLQYSEVYGDHKMASCMSRKRSMAFETSVSHTTDVKRHCPTSPLQSCDETTKFLRRFCAACGGEPIGVNDLVWCIPLQLLRILRTSASKPLETVAYVNHGELSCSNGAIVF